MVYNPENDFRKRSQSKTDRKPVEYNAANTPINKALFCSLCGTTGRMQSVHLMMTNPPIGTEIDEAAAPTLHISPLFIYLLSGSYQ